MNQISRELYKDPTIDAIMSKRPAYIENAYNKNLRNNDPKRRTESMTSVNVSKEDRERMILFSEKTDVTDLMSVINEMERSNSSNSEDDDEARNRNYDGGATSYQTYCYGLKIGPSSIVLKSLLTNTLSLSNYGLNSIGLLALATALRENFTVTKLDLSGNEIGVSGVKHLATLFDDNTTITDLNIARNFIGSDAVKHLVDIFKRNALLRHVDLSHNDLADEDGVIIAECLEEHMITHLNLSHNKFGEKSGVAIGKWLGENGYLLDLDLSWNHIRKNPALCVAKGVSDNNKLLKINLSWNGFGNEGAVALGKALAHNVMLEELDVRSNRIGPQGFVSLFSCFKENNSLKKISIGRNNINNESLEIVLKLFKSLNPLSLLTLDVSNVTLKPTIDEHIESVRETHPNFKCLYGFLNFEERKTKNLLFDQSVLLFEEYCEKNNIVLTELYSNLYGNDITTVSYDEFKEGVNKMGLHMKSVQLESLLTHMDKAQIGCIDFSDLVLFDEQIKKTRKNKRVD